MSADSVEVRKDMGVTHADCRRILPAVTPEVELQWQGSIAVARWPDRKLEVRLGPEERRAIASLSLPRTEITLRFTGFSPAQRESLLQVFDRRFQRGGG